MNAKSPVSAAVVMLVVAVFILGGLTGYAAGTRQVAVAAAPAPGMVPAGTCPMGAEGDKSAPAVAGKAPAEAAMCPMSGKAKPDAACAMGGKKGECSEHAGCPDAGKCGAPATKGAAATPATCPMGGGKTASAEGDACSHGADATAKPAAKASTGKADGAKAVYVCPMCPGVKSDSAAKCPKCGMDLVKK